MPSIENFYWILYENILKPFGIDCYYYYPFGTQKNLSIREEFQQFSPKRQHHVLFHFDQEPLWSDDLGQQYDADRYAWSLKCFRVLANSEHSAFKKTICKNREMLDWYFFYHGFAALNWFRDSQYIHQNARPNKIFSSLNHLTTGNRAYRMALTARFFHRNLVQFGDISFHSSASTVSTELQNYFSPLSDQDKRVVTEQLLPSNCLPLILDTNTVNGTLSAQFGHREYRLWQNSFVHLVNETVFYHDKLHLTEKIFKPIVSLRPFVLAAAPGNLAYLRSYGFETFDRWWDESYDTVVDPDTRSEMIVDIIENLCGQSQDDLIRMHREMQPVLEFNKQHFFGDFNRRIVDELIENFEACVRVWNNGRIDDTHLCGTIDSDRVKRLLCK